MSGIERCRSAAVLAALHGECFPSGWEESAIADLLAMPGATAWIATVEDKPEGFVLLRQAADEAEIITIGVRAESRRLGLARALLRAAADDLIGCARLFLEVSEKNTGARKFYESAGFKEAGRRRAYYADGSDAIVMVVALPISCG
ncbi:MAG: ribosomal protein S18-alanine N-acetyltransferase [Minwuia sp.]|uniref:ribosomal protein S18-alanine N-acetyltransferase n=1 Tax=Minwuia sp. TaxID=2493630 RepID=UPI003A83C94D